MKKFAFVWAAAAAMSLALVACGDDDDDTIDAAVEFDAPPTFDAAIDAEDRGDVEDFDECVLTEDCANLNSDCRTVFFLQTKLCLPRCTDSDGNIDQELCDFGFYCVPTLGGLLGSNGAVMGGHCVMSLCGEGWANGTTGGACKMGGETFEDDTGLHDGWCYPIADGQVGQCLEVGTQGPGDVCDFSTQSRDGDNCDATSICLGQEGAATGFCAQLCDPTTIDDDAATNTGCPTGQDCLDWSEVTTYSDGESVVSTLAVCYEDLIACHIVGSNTCPNDSTGAAQGCAQTNPVRPTGICDPGATGALTGGELCPQSPTGFSQQCEHGTFCIGETATTLHCETFCDRVEGTPVVDCTTVGDGYTCQQVLWDEGFDKTAGTADDNYTAGWGLCTPPAP